MLVLTRQRDQTVMIGDEIEVAVVDIRGDKVRLGISAPRSVSVHRKEIYDQIRRENQEAAALQPVDVESALTKSPPHPFPRLAEPPPPPDPLMRQALAEARAGLTEGGLPIGSILVRAGQVIARGHNRRVQNNDPMAHAEIDCLTKAGRLPTYHDTVLYSTLMPCYLCAGAVVQFGIPKVVVGDTLNFSGAVDFLRSKGVEVVDLRDPDCIDLMGKFIQQNPKLWNEDIGR